MKLEHADMLARDVADKLRPYCDRIEIASSVRRRKPEVGDIEIVCIPRMITRDDVLPILHTDGGCLINHEMMRDPLWAKIVRSLGDVIKGDPASGKYVQVELQDEQHGGIAVDIFTAHKRNWGLIYAIRTGSATYSHKVLACGWVANGYHSVAGMLMRDGVEVPTFEEDDVFALAGVPWCEPQLREVCL